MKRLVIIALLATVTPACGSDIGAAGTGRAAGIGGVPEMTDANGVNLNGDDGASSQADPVCTGQTRSGACLIHPAGVPFVSDAVAVTDGVSTAHLKNATLGTVCVSGTLADAGPTNANWGSTLSLGLAEWGGTPVRIVAPFDADALGITQIQFTIEIRPVAGVAPGTIPVVVALNGVMHLNGCPGDPLACVTPHPFMLTNEIGEEELISSTRTITAPIRAFQDLWGSQVLETTRMNALMFGVGARQGKSPGYDFCVQGLKFLDGDGKEVMPTK